MLGLLNLFTWPTRTEPRSTPRRVARLWLEQLESRDCPSSSSGPSLTMALNMNGQKSVTLSGVVSDNTSSPANLTVNFTGVVNATAVTDQSGYYSLTMDADCLGDIAASTMDGDGRSSNTAH